MPPDGFRTLCLTPAWWASGTPSSWPAGWPAAERWPRGWASWCRGPLEQSSPRRGLPVGLLDRHHVGGHALQFGLAETVGSGHLARKLEHHLAAEVAAQEITALMLGRLNAGQ